MNNKNIPICAASKTIFKNMVAFAVECKNGKYRYYIGKKENYHKDFENHIFFYNNADNSLIFLSNNEKIFSMIEGGRWIHSQSKMKELGFFTDKDYQELYKLLNSKLKKYQQTAQILFDVYNKNGGTPFIYTGYKEI